MSLCVRKVPYFSERLHLLTGGGLARKGLKLMKSKQLGENYLCVCVNLIYINIH